MIDHISYLVICLAVLVIILSLISYISLQQAKNKLRMNRKRLVEMYKDYILFLTIYRDILIIVKSGHLLNDNDLKRCEQFAKAASKIKENSYG